MAVDAATFVTTTLASEQLACIVDARLALSRGGLLAVTTLASLPWLEIWLSGELREIVKQPKPFVEHPELLLPPASAANDGVEEAELLRRELEGWDRWMANGETGSGATRLFFLGDRPDESAVPAGTEQGLRGRFELLQCGLERLAPPPSGDVHRSSRLTACHRDAVALSAALLPRRSVVLTRLELGENDGPLLCQQLRSWGVRVLCVSRHGASASLSLQSALRPLSWAGVRVAVLHVLMPGFPTVLRARNLDDGEVARAWLETDVFWYEATP